MRRKYLIATHGKLASGLQHSLNILTGPGEQIQVIDAYVTAEDFTPEIVAFIDSIGSEDQGIIFTDLYGGSVNQKVAAELFNRQNQAILLISNANLAIILSLMFYEEGQLLTEATVRQLLEESQVQLVKTQVENEDIF